MEQILWHELGSKEDYDKQFPDTALGELIRSITGLTQEAANQAFAEFLSKQNLTAPQSNYLKTIIDYVVKNGLVKDNRELTEPPFTTVGRITEIFPLEDALRIMHVLESIKVNAVRVS
ncbi:type I restriction-modification enzyme R subunit C-terminal domain-containing protein [Sporomusa sp.]|uniref:type I restriction-modification enzyme R subunit C-terminal domain-containing protein n=1 Tax=Sporomusa sp. TaxID=2078658 RepID=UPI002B5A40E7|nr:type I restriction-modification enzyme R subunit C-terminal domain-containing protein [Sporomusa sp.]HWR09295.1 type I restriction-modification enzyme R subunit C-terminal domain-containing protein [Sporomusa sp.]